MSVYLIRSGALVKYASDIPEAPGTFSVNDLVTLLISSSVNSSSIGFSLFHLQLLLLLSKMVYCSVILSWLQRQIFDSNQYLLLKLISPSFCHLCHSIFFSVFFVILANVVVFLFILGQVRLGLSCCWYVFIASSYFS